MPVSLLTNAGIASAGRLVNLVLGVLALALLSRILGPDQYGRYVVLVAIATIGQIAADCGLYLTITREIGRSEQRLPLLLAHGMSLRLLLVLLSLALAGITTLLVPSLRGLTTIYIVLAAGFVFQSLSQLLMGVFQYYQTVWYATIGDIVGRAVQIIGIVLAASIHPTLGAVALAFTAGTAVSFLIYQTLLPAQAHFRLAASWEQWRRLVRVSWPLGLLLVVNAIYFRIDALLLALFRSAAEVGYYGLAYRMIESSLFFPAMLGGLLLPRLSASYTQKSGRARQYIEEALRILILGGALLIIILSTQGENIIRIVAGSEFTPAAPLLALLSWALGIMFIGNVFGFALVAYERQRSLLILYVVLAVQNVVMNLLFIPRWGATAAAWTTILTEAAATTIAGILLYRLVPFSLSLRFAWRGLLIVGATVLLSMVLSMAWGIELALVIIFFCAAVVLAKLVVKDQLRLLTTTDGK